MAQRTVYDQVVRGDATHKRLLESLAGTYPDDRFEVTSFRVPRTRSAWRVVITEKERRR